MVCAVLMAASLLAQPQIELPPEPPEKDTATLSDGLNLGMHNVPDTDLVRGLQAMRLQAPGTTLGSYGQFNLQYIRDGDVPWTGVANLERLVIFVSHHFTDAVHGYLELEWEDAFLAVEVEQAFVDWTLMPEATLRSGLVLVPIGIQNQWHEPPVFHGVKRTDVETYVIPTTWRELGVGSVGQWGTMWRYEAYITVAPDAALMGDLALRFSSTRGSLTPGNAWMIAGRVEAEPLLGVVVGISAMAGDLGDDVRFFNEAGERDSLHLPLWGGSLDARWRRNGLEARLLGSVFGFPEAGALMASRRADGSLTIDPTAQGVVPTLWGGAYAEVAYDILHGWAETSHQLLPFVRIEYLDTQARMPAGFRPNHAREVLVTSAGFSYRPLQQLVFKSDFQYRSRRDGTDESALDVGMGYMF